MKLPQELEVWYVIPAIRKELALAMKNNGLKQVEIANMLNVTKAAITQYVNDKRGSEIKLNESIKKEIKNSSKRVNNKIDALREIQHLIKITREDKLVCQIHKNLEKGFDDCDACFEEPLIQIGIKK